MTTMHEKFGSASPFEQRDDSEASKLFRAMVDVPDDGLLTYDDLGRVLGRSFTDNRTPWFNALRRWHRDRPGTGTFVNVPKVGYRRVLHWEEAKSSGRKHEKKMRRQARKARDRYNAADSALMTDEQKVEQSNTITRLGRLEVAMRSQQKDLLELKRTKADKNEVAELRETVAKLAKVLDTRAD